MELASIATAVAAASIVFNPLFDETMLKMNAEVREIIKNTDSKHVCQMREGLMQHWERLFKNEVIEATGADADYRPYFVGLQLVIEQALSNLIKAGEIVNVEWVISTPDPCTPLCTKGSPSPTLADKDLLEDEKRKFTIEERATTVRDCLRNHCHLYVVYSKENSRTPEELAIFKHEVDENPVYLHNMPVPHKIPLDIVGAIYTFKSKDGHQYGFAIKIPQANATRLDGNYGLWFGDVREGAPIEKRMKEVGDVLHTFTSGLPF